MFSIDLIHNEKGLEALEGIWDELIEYCEFPTPFQLYSWCRAWWKVFGENKKLLVLVINYNGVPIGIAPLMLSGRSGKGTIEFIGTGNADYTDFIIKPKFKKDALHCLLTYLVQNVHGWTKISLSQINERTGTLKILKGLFSDFKYPFRSKEVERCHVYKYTGDTSQRKNFDSGLAKHKTLRKNLNFFNKNGGVTYEVSSCSVEINSRLPELYFFHWRRWENTPTPSKFINKQDRQLYYELTTALSEQNIVRLETLKMGNKSIAYIYSLVYNNSLYLYTVAHNIFFNKKSPGIVLLYYITSNYIRNGFNNIDYMRGGEQYKAKLTNKSYVNYQIILYKKKYEFKLVISYAWLKNSSLGQRIVNNKSIKLICKCIQSNIGRHGLVSSIKHVLRHCFRFFFELRQFYVCTYADKPQRLEAENHDLGLVEVDNIEADIVTAFYGGEMKSKQHELIQKKIADGDRCFALNYNGLYVAMCFVHFHPFKHLMFRKKIKLDKSNAVLSEMTFIPEFHKKHIIVFFYTELVKKIQNEGYHSVLILMNDNSSSIKELLTNWEVIKKYYSLNLIGQRIF